MWIVGSNQHTQQNGAPTFRAGLEYGYGTVISRGIELPNIYIMCACGKAFQSALAFLNLLRINKDITGKEQKSQK